MPGQDINEVEIENLIISDDGRGLIFYDDAVNFKTATTSPWTGVSSQSAGASKTFFPAASSLAWLKIHYISGSTFGATGATGYIPVFRNLNINIA